MRYSPAVYLLIALMIAFLVLSIYIYVQKTNAFRPTTIIITGNTKVEEANQSTLLAVAKSPIYRNPPVIGAYTYVIKSGIENLSNGYIVAYVYINMSIYKPGDPLPVFAPINVNSKLPESLLNNPIVNFTNIMETYRNGSFNVSYTAVVPAVSITIDGEYVNGTAYNYGHAFGYILVNSMGSLTVNSYLHVEFKAVNENILELLVYIGPE